MEVKVGALIIVSLALLAGFVVVMGGMSLEPTYRVFVDFDNPGGLQSGAPVRISGVKVGRITAIQFRGGQLNPKTKEPEPPIRVVAQIENQYRDAIRENSRWFVTSQGVLGEMFLAIEPGAYDRPVLPDGAIVHGISPPRLDLLLIDTEGYDLELLELFDFERFRPDIVRFEHVHLSRADWDEAVELLARRGYRVLREEYDTTAYLSPRTVDRASVPH